MMWTEQIQSVDALPALACAAGSYALGCFAIPHRRDFVGLSLLFQNSVNVRIQFCRSREFVAPVSDRDRTFCVRTKRQAWGFEISALLLQAAGVSENEPRKLGEKK
jgi:diadenosine tetraphosphatase ApaH/serine/threonine PP2A family protein phosphatase